MIVKLLKQQSKHNYFFCGDTDTHADFDSALYACQAVPLITLVTDENTHIIPKEQRL